MTLRDAGSPLLRGAICRVALAVSLFSLLLWGSVLNPIAKQRAPNNIRREHHVHVITVRRLKDPHALLTRSIAAMPSYRTLVTAPAPLKGTRRGERHLQRIAGNPKFVCSEASEMRGTEDCHCRTTFLICGELKSGCVHYFNKFPRSPTPSIPRLGPASHCLRWRCTCSIMHF